MSERSVLVRNYALAALCIAAIFGIGSFVYLDYYRETRYDDRNLLDAYARCEGGNTAVIVLRTNMASISNVTCKSLDEGLFAEDLVEIGYLGKGSQDVCVFVSDDKLAQPPRFEIRFNEGQTMRASCENGWILR